MHSVCNFRSNDTDKKKLTSDTEDYMDYMHLDTDQTSNVDVHSDLVRYFIHFLGVR